MLASAPIIASPAEDAGPPQTPPPEPPAFLVDRLAAGVSASWYSSDSLRYLTRVHFDFPFFVARHKGLYVRGALSSSISRIENRKYFRLEVEDVDYLFEAGARDYLTPRVAVAIFAGQQGSDNLDRAGSAHARYLGLGAQSSTFPRPGGASRFDWNLNVGSVLQTQQIDAHWMVRGDALWDALRLEHSSVGLDLSFDSLIEAGRWETDWWSGPRWSFDLNNGIRASLFARYLHSRNPLGVGASGLQLGFSYAEGAYRGAHTGPFPDVRGILAAGYGDDRSPATLDVHAVSPPFHIAGRPSLIAIGVDANTLVGRGPDEAWYDLSGAVESEVSARLVASAGVRHRSFHVLGESSSASRDLNLLEAVVHSPGWDFSNRTPGSLVPEAVERWPGRVDWIAGASWVISSSLAADPRWLGSAGAQWTLPRLGRVQPFLLGSGDFGEVSRIRLAAGIALPIDMTITAEYRRESLLLTDRRTTGIVFSLYY